MRILRWRCLIGALGLGASLAAEAAAETRGYVFSMFHTAAYGDKSNCPKGGNGGLAEVKEKIIMRQGYTREQAKAFIAAGGGNVRNLTDENGKRVEYIDRGRYNGEPANIANFPQTVADPEIETVSGKIAYGFNLDGEVEPDSFEDPDSGEKGVDNVLWRVLGCFEMYNVRLPIRPYSEEFAWDTAMDSMPAWVISVSGDDLDKDGDVTVTVDRALNILLRDTRGGAMPGVTFMIDPNPRSHSVFKGRIEDRVLTVEPGELTLPSESQYFPIVRLTQAKLRLKMNDDGSLSGVLGGYQPWMDYYYYVAVRSEEQAHVDLPGVYHAFKRLADGGIDPVTEQERISAAYWMEAVPAFLATDEGTVAEAVMELPPVEHLEHAAQAGASSLQTIAQDGK